MNYKALNVAVIGLGRMGQSHIESIKKMDMNICGIVDISDSVLGDVSQKFNIPLECCFKNAKEMLIQQKPNAVVIATTAPTHAEYAILAAQNQVQYILCEKPIAISLDEANAMLDACTHYGAQFAINHQMRFLPQYTEIKDIIKQNCLGGLSSIHVLGSNFGLAMNVSHYFEMFRFLTDSNITKVQAWFENGKISNPRGVEFEDYSGNLMAHNQDGLKMFVDFSAKAGHGLQVAYLFQYGQIIIDELSGFARSICRKEEFKDLPTSRYCMPQEIKQYEMKPKELINSTVMVWESMLANGDYPSFETGFHTFHCLLAAIESNERNNIQITTNNLSIDSSRKFKWA